jgi:hypothetical protein
VVCDTRGASGKKDCERIAIWQEQGLTQQQRTREEGRRLKELAYKKQNAIMDTISGTIHPHMYAGHTNEGRKKEKTSKRAQRKGESGEW